MTYHKPPAYLLYKSQSPWNVLKMWFKKRCCRGQASIWNAIKTNEVINLNLMYMYLILVDRNSVSWKPKLKLANTFFISFYILILKMFIESFSGVKTTTGRARMNADLQHTAGLSSWLQTRGHINPLARTVTEKSRKHQAGIPCQGFPKSSPYHNPSGGPVLAAHCQVSWALCCHRLQCWCHCWCDCGFWRGCFHHHSAEWKAV